MNTVSAADHTNLSSPFNVPGLDELEFVVVPDTDEPPVDLTTDHIDTFIDGVDRQLRLMRSGPMRHADVVAGRHWRFEQDGDWYLRLGFGKRNFNVPGHDTVLSIDDRSAAIPTLETVRELAEQRRLDGIIGGMLLQSR